MDKGSDMMMTRILKIVVLLGGIGALSLLVNRGVAEAGGAEEGVSLGPAPAWELDRIDGGQLSSEDLAGKIVIIDFWATWCPPCRAEIPGYVELQETYRDQGVVFVGVSLDRGASALSKVRKFVEEYKINYPIVMADSAVVAGFGGVEAIPTTFVIDREGQIIRRKVGYKPKSFFEAILDDLL